MWQNYSQWLIDARSRFEQTSALSRAKQAAAGFRATGTDSGATRRKAEQEHFSSEAERIRQGYTSEQLRRAYVINTQQTGFPFKRSTQKTYKLLESPEDVPTVSYRVGQGGGIPTRDDFEQDRVRLKTVPLYEHMGKTKTNIQRLLTNSKTCLVVTRIKQKSIMLCGMAFPVHQMHQVKKNCL